MSELCLDDFDFSVDNNPDSLKILGDKLLTGDAIIIWRSGMNRKQEREYARFAKRWMELKKVSSPILHVIGFEDAEFRILEKGY